VTPNSLPGTIREKKVFDIFLNGARISEKGQERGGRYEEGEKMKNLRGSVGCQFREKGGEPFNRDCIFMPVRMGEKRKESLRLGPSREKIERGER